MQVQLSYPRVLGDGKPGGHKFYGKGQHEISDEIADHWFTKALMDSGDITVMAPVKAARAAKSDPSGEPPKPAAPAPAQSQAKKSS